MTSVHSIVVDTAPKSVVDITANDQQMAYGRGGKNNLTPSEISENRRMKLVMSGSCLIMGIVLIVSIVSGIDMKEEASTDVGIGGTGGNNGGNGPVSTNGPTNAPTNAPTLADGSPTMLPSTMPTIRPSTFPTATPGAHDLFPELDVAAGQVDISTARFACSQSNAPDSQARFAFDEAKATAWVGAPVDEQWVELDTCCTTKLQRLDIEWGVDYATSYDVMASTNGDDWTTVASAAGKTGGVESVTVPTEVDARFVRLLLKTRSNAANGPSIVSARLVGSGTCPQTACEAYMEPAMSIATRTRNVMCRMSATQKLAQMIQIEGSSPDIGMIDQPNVGVGSILSGGGAAPLSGNFAQDWADRTDDFQRKAMSASPKIPLLYGVDAVHGHTNVMGATVFPHNLNLGATRNATLVREIGAATAREVRATGIHWNFAPCLCIGTEPRWGRFYECFSDRPENVSPYASYIEGLQGTYEGGPGLGGEFSVMATAKHWIADGGIAYGTGYKQRMTDQGIATMTEEELRAVHMPPYFEAIAAQTGAFMASFNSLMLTDRESEPMKMHGHTYMMKDVLRDELQFDGIMVSDWAGIDQIDGDDTEFSVAEVATWVNNHGDLAMVPMNGTVFLSRLQDALAQNLISEERVDISVQRILRYKFELGLFENPYTNPQHLATQIRHPEHVKLAREAVQQSSVLLKNENGALPIREHVLVMGRISEDLGLLSGGWTIDWQGVGGAAAQDKWPQGTSFIDSMREVAEKRGIQVTYKSRAPPNAALNDLIVNLSPDIRHILVAVGENRTYTEDQGDVSTEDMVLPEESKMDLASCGAISELLKLKNGGFEVHCIGIMISGRPLVFTDSELSSIDSFVFSGYPGAETGGMADVLFGDVPFTGKLPFTWPKSFSDIGSLTDGRWNFGDGLTF